jgi:K(+)-stimulated pyrophosphate-energized sodium pump
MNILIKLTCLVGLVIAPIMGEKIKDSEPKAKQNCEMSSDMKCDMSSCASMNKEECSKEKASCCDKH